tara:strand:+ start:1329 stop:1622 length:294 start_codon:yes stop_codon:yes gene_type:complete
MPCSICGGVGHNKLSCSMNPKSKKGKVIATQKKLIAFDKPKPLGEIYEVIHTDGRFLGFTKTKPTTSKPLLLPKKLAPQQPHKKFAIKEKITRADIF